MGQINVSADKRLIADIDRVAAARGVSRPDLLRAAMQELVEAYDGDRLAFAREEGPRLDASLSSLAGQLREAVVELDRSQRESARLAKRLIDATNGGAEAAREAERKLTERLVAQRKEANGPFAEQVNLLRENISSLPALIGEQVASHLDALGEHLAAVTEEARTPRTVRNLVIGREFIGEWPVMAAMSAFWLLAGVLLIIVTGNLLPAVGRSLANQFVDDDAALCRQLNDRFGTEDCAVPDLRRRNALITLKLEQR